MTDHIKKALLEAARLVVFAIPGIAVYVVSNDPVLANTYGGLVLLLLKGVDRAVHENPKTPQTGILPF